VVSRAVQNIIPVAKLQAIVLAGGYGRGEGGVLETAAGDKPYNDIEFYVFTRGNPLFNERHFRKRLDGLGHNLSPSAGLHVEFKVESIKKLRNGEVSMFSYDLVSAHRNIWGDAAIFAGCDHHLDASRIPVSEGTRLLLNRCTGLLLAQEMLDHETLDDDQSDFVGRNLAKAKLALGDALLAGLNQYHWSCRERHARLRGLAAKPSLTISRALLERILSQHEAGVNFKLHPCRIAKSPGEFAAEHAELSALASEVWLWLESLRLEQPFRSLGEYAMNPRVKKRQGFALRNYALNARTFGLSALFDPMSGLYPRERLLCSLPLLLQKTNFGPAMREHLQRQLRTSASDWAGFVRAYKQVWSGYA
jgi:hypothetical protein